MSARIPKLNIDPTATPVVRRLVGRTCCYADGPPAWLEGKDKRQSQTAGQAHAERLRLIKRLRRFGKDNSSALEVASRLTGCGPRRRCFSGACPECARAFQRAVVTATVRFLEADTGRLGRRTTILSPISTLGIIEPGKLDSTILRDVRLHVTKVLASAGVRTAIIGVDLSFNEDRDGAFDPHWLVHVRAIVPRQLPTHMLGQLRKEFPTTALIPKPFRAVSFDGNLTGIAYTIKPSFGRRQSYLQAKPAGDSVRLCRNTRGRPLTGEQAVELAVFLDRIGLRKRLILHGLRLLDTGKGVVIARKETRYA